MASSVATRFGRLVAGPSSKLSVAAAASVLVAGLGTAIRYGLQILIANLAGTSGYGLYLTLRRWSELLATLPNRGYLGTVVRFLPEYEANSQWPLYRELRRRALTITSWGSLVVAVTATAAGLLAWTETPLAVVLAMAAIPAWASFGMLGALLQAKHQYVAASAVDHVLQPAVMFVFVLAVWLVMPQVSVTAIMAALFASLVLALTALWAFDRRSQPDPDAPVAQARHEVSDQTKSGWHKAGRQFYTAQLATVVIGSADMLILAMFVDIAEVGLYGAASRISLLARVFNTGTDSIVAPRIAAAWTDRNLALLQRHVDKAILLATLPTALLAGLLIATRSVLLGIMGDDFRAADDITVILLVGIVVQALTGPCGYVVALTDNEQFNARTLVGAAVFLTIGCFIAAPLGGPIAVALVTAVANVGWNVALVAFARRKLGIRCYLRRGMALR